jgi:3',5'-cyclic AMP phosphodiesterase CpdA
MNQPSERPSNAAVRLAHFSDIHVTARQLRWRPVDWFNKRVTGWINLQVLGRGHRFRDADKVVTALMRDLRARQPDRVVFSGDATSLGFPEELAHAADLLGVVGPEPLPGLAVPGNHDYYTREAAASGNFERYFAPWQQGERVDKAGYPFAQRVGSVWLVAVNSCRGNRWAWDAAGQVGDAQLTRLETLLGRLDAGLRILVTHYPVCLATGRRERHYHGLRDLADLLRVAAQGRISLWLHGHRHMGYHLALPDLAAFPVVCVGTATGRGQWSYGDYTIRENRLFAIQRAYHPDNDSFQDGQRFELDLPA